MALKSAKLDEEGVKALNLRLSEQYMEALEEIMKKSSTLMIPEGSSTGELGSPASVAQIMATYNHLSRGGSSQQMAESLMNNGQLSPDSLKNIVRDLENLKKKEGSGLENSGKNEYRYLDDKTLYSTD